MKGELSGKAPGEAGSARAKQSVQHAASRQVSPARFPSGAPRVPPTPRHTIKTNYIVTILICCTITMFSIPLPNIDGVGTRGSSHAAVFWPWTTLFTANCFRYRARTSNPAFYQLREAASHPSTRHYPVPLQPLQHL